MNFELGKEYIVAVTNKGMVPIDEFNRERFYDKDNDDLDFLTDEEKTIIENQAYNKGLNDAWECAKQLRHPATYDGALYDDEKKKIFGYISSDKVLTHYTASEAIAKIKEYEENNNNSKTDDLLKEGDEIIILDHNSDYHNKKGIITYVSDCGKYTEVLFSDGDFSKYCNGYFKKTGKSYPELGNILEQLKGDEEINR